MRTRAEIAQLLDRLLSFLVEQDRKDDVPAPEPDEPEPPRLRQSQQPGIDMRAMGMSAQDQARRQSYRRMFRR